MIHDDSIHDEYETLEQRFSPFATDRKARRSRKPKARHIAKKSEQEIIEEIADVTGLEGGFKTTYKPSRYEEGFLLQALQSFYDRDMISDVLAVVRGGKEATVYCCAAHETMGVPLVAAKVYRPRMFRQLRNDSLYREGRAILQDEGNPPTERDTRIQRAIRKGSAFGLELEHKSWLLHEFKTLETLYTAGAAVPKPFAVGENAILMSYYGDEALPAPALSEIALDDDEAGPLFKEVMRNIDLMLQHGLIHGDLSAYNILYWEGAVTLIDFPQVTNVDTNRSAYFILSRDVRRVCEHFQRYGVRCDPEALTNKLWERYHTPEDLLPEEPEIGDDEG